jgi:hypothetical protein
MRAVCRCCPKRVQAQAILADDWRLARLIDRLPNRVRSTVRFLRRPSVRWLRFPMGLLLAFGGILGFLPIFGFWMLPIGLALLAEDIPPLRSGRSRILDWIEHRRPNWLADGPGPQ